MLGNNSLWGIVVEYGNMWIKDREYNKNGYIF